IYEYLRENFESDIKMDIVMKEEEFVSALSLKKYDLILADFMLPDFNGFVALEHVKSICPATPFICVSGFIGEETAVELLKKGATDYVSKDKLGRLKHSIERAIKEAKENEEKEKRAAELIIANKELAFQNEEKEKRVAELSKANAYLNNLFNNSNVAIIISDEQWNIKQINRTFKNLTGYSEDEVLGKSISILFPLDKVNESINRIKNSLDDNSWDTIEIEILHIDGSVRTLLLNTAIVFDSDGLTPVSIICQGQDITERKKSEKEILYLSYYDQLTGLYNRRFYEEDLKRLDTRRNLPLSLIMGDVNGLKLINDSFGHAMGDELLKKAAKVIKKGCRIDDIIARHGGDEFVIILPKTNAAETEKIIERIKDLSANEKIGGFGISISFGCETKEKEDENIKAIFKKAEDRMYRDKLYESPSIRGKTIELIMSTLYEKSQREHLHSIRVGALCAAIAAEMDFSKDDVNQIRTAGLMHDIGKIGIDDKILNTPRELRPDEWQDIKRHPEIGYRILSSVNEFSKIADQVLQHHEQVDGEGYPKGLKRNEILLESMIIAVAEAFEAMTSDWTFRRALSEEEAINELKRCSGTKFDPDITRLFIEKVLGKD
ncbi:diguanylate cyclase, partial [Acetobacterium sp.]|uniref:diguanylate cyclase n=1 Tax=Acetobacterium sp. TaxID=1872094 RepID=UPI002F4205FE